jgi:glucosamine--fructose-6-phosphate aminotransferase (isomerizing)
MGEQPELVRRIGERRAEVAAGVRRLMPQPVGIALTARGSSLNASLFGRHALTIATNRPVMIEPLSLAGAYGARVDRDGWLHVATSQSGATPEIVAAQEVQQALGARTIAITNDPRSALARSADLSLALGVGPERAVPATKTLLAQFLTFVQIAGAFDPRFSFPDAEWDRLGAAVQACLDDAVSVATVAERLEPATALVVSGRGYGFAVAREGALKLKETTGLPCEAISHPELLHGSIAVTGTTVPTVLIDLAGPTRPAADQLTAELRRRGAAMVSVGDTGGADLPIPAGFSEVLAAVLAVVRFQQLALELATMRGVDADAPHELSKVTLT